MPAASRVKMAGSWSGHARVMATTTAATTGGTTHTDSGAMLLPATDYSYAVTAVEGFCSSLPQAAMAPTRMTNGTWITAVVRCVGLDDALHGDLVLVLQAPDVLHGDDEEDEVRVPVLVQGLEHGGVDRVAEEERGHVDGVGEARARGIDDFAQALLRLGGKLRDLEAVAHGHVRVVDDEASADAHERYPPSRGPLYTAPVTIEF